MLAGADRVARDMAAYGRGVKGQVRVLASVSSIAEFLPDDVADFMQAPEHRDIRVDIEEILSRDLVRAIREGVASLGVCWDAADLEGLETRPYRRDRLAIVAHASHPIARRRRCSFEETLAFEHVGLPASTAVHTMLARAMPRSSARPSAIARWCRTFDASLRCVRANLGIAVMPSEVATPFAAGFDLRVVPLTDAWAERRFAICFRSHEGLSPSARLLVAHLERLAKSPSRPGASPQASERPRRLRGSSS